MLKGEHHEEKVFVQDREGFVGCHLEREHQELVKVEQLEESMEEEKVERSQTVQPAICYKAQKKIDVQV